MIRAAACKINDFRVKDLSTTGISSGHHSGAMDCNLCLELAHFSLQSPRTSFIQHFPKPPVRNVSMSFEWEINQMMSYLQKSGWIRCNPTLSGFSGWIEGHGGHGGSMPRRFSLEIRRSGEADCRSRLLQVALISRIKLLNVRRKHD